MKEALDKDCALNSAVASPAETVLRDELARADRALAGAAPVLEHLLAGAGRSLLSDALVARVQGMLNDLASQFAMRLQALRDPEVAADMDGVEELARLLASDSAILKHLHAAAIEGALTQKLDQRGGMDPVLSPLLQELIASPDALVAETAMQALTAQSRFMQGQGRLQQPVLDLPPETLELALRIWVRSVPMEHEPIVTQAMRDLKLEYDEAKTRHALFARLVGSMRSGVVAALDLDHAGAALFISAIALRTGQTRDRVAMSCHEHQASRLAISLRAAGLEPDAIERQFVRLDPAGPLPTGLGGLSSEAARAMIEDSAARSGMGGSL